MNAEQPPSAYESLSGDSQVVAHNHPLPCPGCMQRAEELAERRSHDNLWPTEGEPAVSADDDAAHLARTSSPELLAHLLTTERREHAEARQRWDTERARLLAAIDGAGRIGVRVLQAQATGRKTVRITEVVGDDDA